MGSATVCCYLYAKVFAITDEVSQDKKYDQYQHLYGYNSGGLLVFLTILLLISTVFLVKVLRKNKELSARLGEEKKNLSLMITVFSLSFFLRTIFQMGMGHYRSFIC